MFAGARALHDNAIGHHAASFSASNTCVAKEPSPSALLHKLKSPFLLHLTHQSQVTSRSVEGPLKFLKSSPRTAPRQKMPSWDRGCAYALLIFPTWGSGSLFLGCGATNRLLIDRKIRGEKLDSAIVHRRKPFTKNSYDAAMNSPSGPPTSPLWATFNSPMADLSLFFLAFPGRSPPHSVSLGVPRAITAVGKRGLRPLAQPRFLSFGPLRSFRRNPKLRRSIQRNKT
jgi:hypothetical protein